jgi:predicted site-specific integrase-resolvase
MTTATEVKTITREEACAQLGLKDRMLRTYIAAGKLRCDQDGSVHAGDVAKLAAERQGKRAATQMRAVANVPSDLNQAQRKELARMAAAVGKGGSGTAALLQLSGKPAKRQRQPEVRLFDTYPPAAHLRLREAARYIRMSVRWTLAELEAGRLPGVKLADKTWRIRKGDLDRLP